MPRSLSRRQALAAGTALGAGALTASLPTPGVAAPLVGKPVVEETRSIDELYRAALAEGGKLVVYAGGDIASQQTANVQAFTQQFPGVDLTMVVDYSKFHDARIDNQLATDTLVADVGHFQTLQDFPRWKKEGHLLAYKPAGFSKVHPTLRDSDGAWVAIRLSAFSFMYDIAAAGAHAPRTPEELVDPRWKGRIASSYPNDDDASLFLYKQYAETYGWDWVARLAAQDIQFARGTHTPALAVNNKQKIIGVGGSGAAVTPAGATPRWAIPEDGAPFMAWGQRAAIFRRAAHPEAAKLYLNWWLSTSRQQSATGWSVRTDITPPSGLRPAWEYPNAHFAEFPRFMADRAEVERWKETFTLYFGEVKGDPSPGWPGLHPGR
ncbi:ABC transporter substrate-binding protein [Streptomyces sp. NPDC004237]|uniref:ABC transporter substrate-binding protein n=1 Tax=Streptomyces sp. NPDC004237 TaxID=3154455 RepID=UPI00339E9DDD